MLLTGCDLVSSYDPLSGDKLCSASIMLSAVARISHDYEILGD